MFLLAIYWTTFWFYPGD